VAVDRKTMVFINEILLKHGSLNNLKASN